MKKSFLIKSFAVLSLLLIVTACSKYEEGSKFTVLTKTQRMVNTWTLRTSTYNGNNQTINGTSTWKLDKDGKCTYTYVLGSFTFTDVGTWAFTSDKASIIITDSSNDAETFEIVQLKNKDLKLRQVVDGNTTIGTYTGL